MDLSSIISKSNIRVEKTSEVLTDELSKVTAISNESCEDLAAIIQGIHDFCQNSFLFSADLAQLQQWANYIGNNGLFRTDTQLAAEKDRIINDIHSFADWMKTHIDAIGSYITIVQKNSRLAIDALAQQKRAKEEEAAYQEKAYQEVIEELTTRVAAEEEKSQLLVEETKSSAEIIQSEIERLTTYYDALKSENLIDNRSKNLLALIDSLKAKLQEYLSLPDYATEERGKLVEEIKALRIDVDDKKLKSEKSKTDYRKKQIEDYRKLRNDEFVGFVDEFIKKVSNIQDSNVATLQQHFANLTSLVNSSKNSENQIKQARDAISNLMITIVDGITNNASNIYGNLLTQLSNAQTIAAYAEYERDRLKKENEVLRTSGQEMAADLTGALIREQELSQKLEAQGIDFQTQMEIAAYFADIDKYNTVAEAVKVARQRVEDKFKSDIEGKKQEIADAKKKILQLKKDKKADAQLINAQQEIINQQTQQIAQLQTQIANIQSQIDIYVAAVGDAVKQRNQAQGVAYQEYLGRLAAEQEIDIAQEVALDEFQQKQALAQQAKIYQVLLNTADAMRIIAEQERSIAESERDAAQQEAFAEYIKKVSAEAAAYQEYINRLTAEVEKDIVESERDNAQQVAFAEYLKRVSAQTTAYREYINRLTVEVEKDIAESERDAAQQEAFAEYIKRVSAEAAAYQEYINRLTAEVEKDIAESERDAAQQVAYQEHLKNVAAQQFAEQWKLMFNTADAKGIIAEEERDYAQEVALDEYTQRVLAQADAAYEYEQRMQAEQDRDGIRKRMHQGGHKAARKIAIERDQTRHAEADKKAAEQRASLLEQENGILKKFGTALKLHWKKFTVGALALFALGGLLIQARNQVNIKDDFIVRGTVIMQQVDERWQSRADEGGALYVQVETSKQISSFNTTYKRDVLENPTTSSESSVDRHYDSLTTKVEEYIKAHGEDGEYYELKAEFQRALDERDWETLKEVVLQLEDYAEREEDSIDSVTRSSKDILEEIDAMEAEINSTFINIPISSKDLDGGLRTAIDGETSLWKTEGVVNARYEKNENGQGGVIHILYQQKTKKLGKTIRCYRFMTFETSRNYTTEISLEDLGNEIVRAKQNSRESKILISGVLDKKENDIYKGQYEGSDGANYDISITINSDNSFSMTRSTYGVTTQESSDEGMANS